MTRCSRTITQRDELLEQLGFPTTMSRKPHDNPNNRPAAPNEAARRSTHVPVPSTALIKTALKRLRSLERPFTEVDVLTHYSLVALPRFEHEPHAEARAAAFSEMLRAHVAELLSHDQTLGIIADELFFSQEHPLSISDRYTAAIARIADSRLTGRKQAEYLEDKALNYLAEALVTATSDTVGEAKDNSAQSLSIGDSYEYVEHESRLMIVPERPNEQTCATRVAIRPLVGDLQVVRLFYYWTGTGDRPQVTLIDLPQEYYLGTFPEPISGSKYWCHLIYVGELKVDTRGLISLEFVERFVDTGGTFTPEFAYTPFRDSMTFLRLSVQLPPSVETAVYSEIVNPNWRPAPRTAPVKLRPEGGWFAFEHRDYVDANVCYVIEWDDSGYKLE
jgi:hypothetical protein